MNLLRKGDASSLVFPKNLKRLKLLMMEISRRCQMKLMLVLWIWIEEVTATYPASWIVGGGAGGGKSNIGVAVGVTAVAGLALVATFIITSRRGSLKSPWTRRRHVLTGQHWKSFFTPDGKLEDGGVQFLKKVRSGGVDPTIRAEVWPFLLGVYDLNSTEAERKTLIEEKRKEYLKLRKKCITLLKHTEMNDMEKKGIDEIIEADNPNFNGCHESTNCEGALHEQGNLDNINTDLNNGSCINTTSLNPDDLNKETIMDNEEEQSGITEVDSINTDQIENSCSNTEKEVMNNPEEEKSGLTEVDNSSDDDTKKVESNLTPISKLGKSTEDFDTWQRIIRLDAIRANAEWVPYSPTQAAVSEETALKHATSVKLKDHTHLEPCRIYHASRLVAILEAYALYDQEIGYCQGMSDLLSPLLAVIEDDNLAFWCFVGFMKKARHNFRLDEVGIRRQLNMVAKIIKFRDPHLYRHLEKLQAEDCFFVYRMVVVLFRRELDFEQILCLWEVMWADQTAIRAGIEQLTRGRISLRAPPTDDLLLYAIAASVLERRKLIIQSYSSMDEIIRECNNMAGRLDVWNLLENAHDLVAALHDKI